MLKLTLCKFLLFAFRLSVRDYFLVFQRLETLLSEYS